MAGKACRHCGGAVSPVLETCHHCGGSLDVDDDAAAVALGLPATVQLGEGTVTLAGTPVDSASPFAAGARPTGEAIADFVARIGGDTPNGHGRGRSHRRGRVDIPHGNPVCETARDDRPLRDAGRGAAARPRLASRVGSGRCTRWGFPAGSLGGNSRPA